ncbi:hypothetical protein G9X67_18235 [Rhizobium sp. WYCCWR 11152]|uniref:hypothetical protein n=1 Tax=Rhizobium sp. WYCCWR 11152 TaxID=2692316 RepID=UPI001492E695|nr:hypothetical protein [Rhizobium sp. WYCCWR 11152]NNU67201.1 hypothetical protein [Rhizobium sp. WYCCWR 11152]
MASNADLDAALAVIKRRNPYGKSEIRTQSRRIEHAYDHLQETRLTSEDLATVVVFADNVARNCFDEFPTGESKSVSECLSSNITVAFLICGGLALLRLDAPVAKATMR